VNNFYGDQASSPASTDFASAEASAGDAVPDPRDDVADDDSDRDQDDEDADIHQQQRGGRRLRRFLSVLAEILGGPRRGAGRGSKGREKTVWALVGS
jgi:hypothetical protein